MGIGLTMAKHIVELHGGSIEVESAVGAGSTFTFVIPVDPNTAFATDENKTESFAEVTIPD